MDDFGASIENGLAIALKVEGAMLLLKHRMASKVLIKLFMAEYFASLLALDV